MKLSSNTIILLIAVLLIIFAVAFLVLGKKTPVYAPQTQTQATPSINSDLKSLDSTDPNSLNNDLQQLDSQSSSL